MKTCTLSIRSPLKLGWICMRCPWDSVWREKDKKTHYQYSALNIITFFVTKQRSETNSKFNFNILISLQFFLAHRDRDSHQHEGKLKTIKHMKKCKWTTLSIKSNLSDLHNSEDFTFPQNLKRSSNPQVASLSSWHFWSIWMPIPYWRQYPS